MKPSSSSHLVHSSLEFEAGRELQTLLAKAVDIKVEYFAYDGNSTDSPDTETLWEAQLCPAVPAMKSTRGRPTTACDPEEPVAIVGTDVGYGPSTEPPPG